MDQRFSSRRRGEVAIFFCAVFWSTAGLFIKLVDWNPILIAGARSFFALFLLLPIRLLSSKPAKKPAPENQAAGRLWARVFKSRFVIFGGLAYAATMIIFVIANKLTTSANAVLLQYSAPVWAALLGWLIAREKPHWEHWGALVLVFGGMVLFFKDSLGGGNIPGDILAVISGISFGANSVFMRMNKQGNPMDSMILSHIITALFSIPFFFMYPPVFSMGAVFPVIFLGVIQVGIATVLFSFGIKSVTAVESMLIAMVEPVLNPLWVFLVTGEKPSLSALAGGAIIVSAVIASSIIGKRREAGNL
ncbi:MAG: DMT family transporter [Treponema sp.]|jgi:drug/metabolite transporter (DMT)-like permease|nr:DMT family transporter [Treponema sp.]